MAVDLTREETNALRSVVKRQLDNTFRGFPSEIPVLKSVLAKLNREFTVHVEYVVTAGSEAEAEKAVRDRLGKGPDLDPSAGTFYRLYAIEK
jgi:hypothetical protein